MGKRTQQDEFSSDEDELPQEKLAWTQEDDDDATTASAHSSAPSKGSKGAKGKERMPEKHCKKNLWLVKPNNENQGKGIKIFDKIADIARYLETSLI